MSLAEFAVEPTNRRETQVAAEANGLTDPGLTELETIFVGTTNIGSTLTTIENDVTELETATTGISYDNTGEADLTTIDNNVTINNTLIVGTKNIGSTLTTIENDVTNLETATTGITYDNTGEADLTTIDNNVIINSSKSLLIGSTNIGSSVSTLVTNTSGITYDDTNDITTIDNNVTINNDLIVGSTDIGSTVSTLVTNTSGITYDDTNDITTIDNNVTINNDLIVGSTNIGSSISTPSNFITAGTDLEWSGSTLNFTGGSSNNTTGISYDDTAGADLTTISNNVTITKNVEVESNFLVTGTNKNLGVSDTTLGYIRIKNLGGASTGAGALQFNNTDNKLFFQKETTDIMSVELDQVKLFQCLTTNDSALDIGDTTTRFNTGYFSTVNCSTQIDTPEVRSQVFRANTNDHMEFQNNSGTVGMVLSTQGRFGIGAWGVSPALTPSHNLSVIGDAFISDDLDVGGTLAAQGGIEPKYVRKRYMRASNTDTGSVNNSTWGSTTPSTKNLSYPTSFNSSGQRKTCTTNFLTESSGVFTFTEAGTYYIRVTFTAVIKTTDRHNVALYFSINDNNNFPILTNSADERGRMGIAYCKDENNVPANTCTFGDMYYFDANDNFRCKCLLDGIDADAKWDNTLASTELDMYIQYEFEKISDDDVSVRWS